MQVQKLLPFREVIHLRMQNRIEWAGPHYALVSWSKMYVLFMRFCNRLFSEMPH